jgi:hypothetical protein
MVCQRSTHSVILPELGAGSKRTLRVHREFATATSSRLAHKERLRSGPRQLRDVGGAFDLDQ